MTSLPGASDSVHSIKFSQHNKRKQVRFEFEREVLDEMKKWGKNYVILNTYRDS